MELGSSSCEDFLVSLATPKDVTAIKQLVLEHGTTQWSSFPEADLENHLKKIAAGTDHAFLAFFGDALVGLVSYTAGDFGQKFEPAADTQELAGYIIEILVHPEYIRRGIATRLLSFSLNALTNAGVCSIYAKRHEQNKASEALLRNNGFQKIDVYSDAHRTTGTGRTVIERLKSKSS